MSWPQVYVLEKVESESQKHVFSRFFKHQHSATALECVFKALAKHCENFNFFSKNDPKSQFSFQIGPMGPLEHPEPVGDLLGMYWNDFHQIEKKSFSTTFLAWREAIFNAFLAAFQRVFASIGMLGAVDSEGSLQTKNAAVKSCAYDCTSTS